MRLCTCVAHSQSFEIGTQTWAFLDCMERIHVRRRVLGCCRVVIAQWSERRQLRLEALGSIPSGYPCIFSSVCFYPDLPPVAYHQFLLPVVVDQYSYKNNHVHGHVVVFLHALVNTLLCVHFTTLFILTYVELPFWQRKWAHVAFAYNIHDVSSCLMMWKWGDLSQLDSTAIFVGSPNLFHPYMYRRRWIIKPPWK